MEPVCFANIYLLLTVIFRSKAAQNFNEPQVNQKKTSVPPSRLILDPEKISSRTLRRRKALIFKNSTDLLGNKSLFSKLNFEVQARKFLYGHFTARQWDTVASGSGRCESFLF